VEEVLSVPSTFSQRSYAMPVYECDCCGACCEGHLLVEAYHLDVLREPRLITIDRHYAGRTLAEALDELADEDKVVLLIYGSACAFLKTDKHCGIYSTRPNVCVAMQAGDEQCQEARSAAGLPRLEPVTS
jgi:Fe-S-cluster containining protein